MSVRIQTSQNVELEYEPASIGDRILATILDRLIYIGWLLFWILVYSLLKLSGDMSVFIIILTISCFMEIKDQICKICPLLQCHADLCIHQIPPYDL